MAQLSPSLPHTSKLPFMNDEETISIIPCKQWGAPGRPPRTLLFTFSFLLGIHFHCYADDTLFLPLSRLNTTPKGATAEALSYKICIKLMKAKLHDTKLFKNVIASFLFTTGNTHHPVAVHVCRHCRCWRSKYSHTPRDFYHVLLY